MFYIYYLYICLLILRKHYCNNYLLSLCHHISSELAPCPLANFHAVFSALCTSRQQTSYINTTHIFRAFPSGTFIFISVLNLILNLRYENYTNGFNFLYLCPVNSAVVFHFEITKACDKN